MIGTIEQLHKWVSNEEGRGGEGGERERGERRGGDGKRERGTCGNGEASAHIRGRAISARSARAEIAGARIYICYI